MQTRTCPALLISAPSSHSGKTTVTAALARYWTQQGKKVRVFKTGPDFLDPMLLEQASGAPVHQLDLWMMGEANCRRRLAEAAQEADLILTTGGVSVGDKDLVPDVIESLNGRVLFHGIRVKPGMPTMLSVVEDIPVLSLSGNPFAVAALFELLVGGYLADRAEEVYIQKKETKVLRQTFVKTGKPKRIVKGKCDEEGVFLPQIQRNGQLKNGIGSNCLVVFPEGERTYPEGEKVTESYGYFLDEYGFTPTVIVSKSGKQEAGFIGYKSEEELFNFIKSKGID